MSICFGCSIEKADLVGTWKASGEYNGNFFEFTLTLKEDDSFTLVKYENDTYSKTESVNYEISKDGVSANEKRGYMIKFTYNNGTLKTGNWIYTKAS